MPGSETYGDAESTTFIRERIRELARGVFDAQGVRAFESPLRSAALHESGHAIVYRALGQPVTRIVVRRLAGHWVGKTSGGLPVAVLPRQQPAGGPRPRGRRRGGRRGRDAHARLAARNSNG